MRKLCACLLILIGICYSTVTVAQKKPATVSILANEQAADVNLDRDKYVAALQAMVRVTETTFSDDSRKVAVVVVSHKQGAPSFYIFSKPQLSAEKENEFLAKLQEAPLVNTKFVDLSVAIAVNVTEGQLSQDFPGINDVADKSKTTYNKASFGEKYLLLKEWAAKEVIPVLASYLIDVEDKYEGVRKTGQFLLKTDFTQPQNIATLFNSSDIYWRGVLEMNPTNQIIPATKVFALVADGKLDYARAMLDILLPFSAANSTAHYYLTGLKERLIAFEKLLHAQINQGIKLHDEKQFAKAIELYKQLLLQYPNSAWARYELYYSSQQLALQNNTVAADDYSLWYQARDGIYACNPLYTSDVHAGNGKEGYLLFRRQSITQLFKDRTRRNEDILTYANIAMDLGVYDFSAQLFWLYFSSIKADDAVLSRLLYSLEKLNAKEIKKNFKIDAASEFRKIDQEKEKEMKESTIYKSFKS